MGSVRKIGDDYYIEFFARGLKYQQKIGPDEKRAAQALNDIESQIARGEAATFVRDVEIDIFFQDFLEYIRDKHTPKTIKRFNSVVESFANYLYRELPTVQNISELTPRVIEGYKIFSIRHPSLSLRRNGQINPNVINLTLLLLRDILQYAIKLGYLNDNPSLHVRFMEESLLAPAHPRVLIGEDRNKFLDHCSVAIRFLSEILLLTGLTISEAVELRWDQVDLEKMCLDLSTQRGRAGAFESWLRVPVSIRAAEIFREMETNSNRKDLVFVNASCQEWAVAEVRTEIRSALCKVLGNMDMGPSILRHSFAVELLKKNVSILQLYLLMGKNDVGKMMIYSPFLKGTSLDE